jgi:hypothetical protein
LFLQDIPRTFPRKVIFRGKKCTKNRPLVTLWRRGERLCKKCGDAIWVNLGGHKRAHYANEGDLITAGVIECCPIINHRLLSGPVHRTAGYL